MEPQVTDDVRRKALSKLNSLRQGKDARTSAVQKLNALRGGEGRTDPVRQALTGTDTAELPTPDMSAQPSSTRQQVTRPGEERRRRPSLGELGRNVVAGAAETGADIVQNAPVTLAALGRAVPQHAGAPPSQAAIEDPEADIAQRREAFRKTIDQSLRGEGRFSEFASKVRELAPETDPELQDQFVVKVARALGSTLPFFASAIGGPVGVGVAGGSAGAGETIGEARAAGVEDASEIESAVGLGFAGGTSEVVPVQRALRRLAPIFGPAAREILSGIGEEFGQEVFQRFVQNVAAGQSFDPDRALTEGVGEAGATGGVVGGILNTLLASVGAGRARFRTRGQTDGIDTDTGQEQEGIEGTGGSDISREETRRGGEEAIGRGGVRAGAGSERGGTEQAVRLPEEERPTAAIIVDGETITGLTHSHAAVDAIERGVIVENERGEYVSAETGEPVFWDAFLTPDGRVINRFESQREFGISGAEQMVGDDVEVPEVPTNIQEPAPAPEQTSQEDWEAAGAELRAARESGDLNEVGRARARMNRMQAYDDAVEDYRREVQGWSPGDPQPTLPNRSDFLSERGAAEDIDADYGAENQIVTRERYKEIQQRVRERLSQANVLSPEDFTLAAEVAVFHAEAGARKFADWSRRMVQDFGEEIRPHLRALYERMRRLEGMNTQDFDSPEEVQRIAQEISGDSAPIPPGGDQSPGDSGGQDPPELTIPGVSTGGDPFQNLQQRLAQAMGEDPKTTGRPDLANPAQTEESRRLVDVTDEIREEQGVPNQQSFEQWQTEANRRLQRDYEGEKQRAFSGEISDDPVSVMVAKEIIAREGQEAIASGDENSLRNLARLIDRYRSLRSETARALAAGRDPLKSPEERRREFAMEAVLSPTTKQRKKLAKAKTESEKDKILRKQGEQIKKIRDTLLNYGIDVSELSDTDLADPRKMAQVVRTSQAVKGDWSDALYEYWINAILSAPTTQIANIIGNTLNASWDFTVQRWTEVALNAIIPGKGESAAQAGELKHLYRGILGPTLRNTWNRAALAFDTETPRFAEEMGYRAQTKFESEASDETALPTGGFDKAIPGRKGRTIRLPGRMLVAADEFAKSIFWSMEVGAQAYRIAKAEGLEGDAMAARINELVSDPQSDAGLAAYDKALDLTFQREGGKVLKSVQSFRQEVPFVRYILPFVMTPNNILKTGIRKSPLGILNVARKAATQGYYTLNKSADDPSLVYTRPAFVRDAAEQVLAWTAMMGLLSVVMNQDDDEPIITGSGGEFGSTERSLQYRGAPPNSIRIGGTYYDYGRIEPIGTALQVMVNTAEQIKKAESGQNIEAAFGEYAKQTVNIARDKSFMQGIGDVMRMIEYPEKGVGRWFARFTTSWSPNIIRSTLRSSDTRLRDYRPKGEGIEWFADLAKKTGQQAVPLSSFGPHARVDVWGREVKRDVDRRPWSDFLWKVTIPIRRTGTEDVHKLDRYILNWNAQNPNETYAPGLPRPDFRLAKRNYRMDDDMYHEYLTEAGQQAAEILMQRNLDPDNPEVDPNILFRRVLDRTRKSWRARAVASGRIKPTD